MPEDLRPLANAINAWLVSPEGEKTRERLSPSQQLEIFSCRDGGYRKTILLSPNGLVEDYYPVTQPTRKGAELIPVVDSLRMIEAMLEGGDFRTLADVEAAIWDKLGVTQKPDST